MHMVIRTIRRIAATDLPRVRDIDGTERAATEQELLNMGMAAVGADLYSCTEQKVGHLITDAATGRTRREYRPHPDCRIPANSTVVSSGTPAERFRGLPDDVRPDVLRAEVIRATKADEPSAQAQAEAVLTEATAALVENVGPDAKLDTTVLAEAQRLVELPDNSVTRVLVPERAVVAGSDVVERTGIIPHSWAGERH